MQLSENKLDQALAYILSQHPDDVRGLLMRNGVVIAGELDGKDLSIAFLKAIKDSSVFRQDLSDYMVGMTMYHAQKGDSPEVISFVSQSGQFLNFGTNFGGTVGGAVGNAVGNSPTPGAEPATAEKKKTALGSVLNAENLSKLFNTGLSVLSDTLKAKANKSSEERALEDRKLQLEIAKLQRGTAAAGAAKKGVSTLGWVGIFIGLAAVGTGVYFLVRKKK